MTLRRLARVGDPISHNDEYIAVIGGAVLGAAVGAFVFFTGGWGGVALGALSRVITTISAAGNAAGTGLILGDWLRAAGGRSVWGHITEGAPTVYAGPTVGRAARAHPSTLVDCHESYVAAGSRTVFIQNANASRVGDATECNGRVEDGCSTIHVGGESVIGGGCRVGDERHGNLYWTTYIIASIGAPGVGLAGKTIRELLLNRFQGAPFIWSSLEIAAAVANVAGVGGARSAGAGAALGSYVTRVRPGPSSSAPARVWWGETGSRTGGVVSRVVNAVRTWF